MRMAPPDPSTQISVISEEESHTNPNMDESAAQKKKKDKVQKIREIVVLPGPELTDAPARPIGGRINEEEAMKGMAEYLHQKRAECQQLVQSSSAVSFTANYLQSRVISTELGAQLAKVYEALEVKRAEDFEQKLEQLSTAEEGEEKRKRIEAVEELKRAFREWEEFLANLDVELERIAGPETQTELGQSGKEIQLVSQQGRLAQNGSLLSYVQSSSFSLMFLEVVASFAVQECYEHVKRMFDALPEFHKLDCDILLLTRSPASGGSGFLKLIGMPFRMLLNESESMRQILMHRQSAQSMAGLRALHIYTEFLCNDQPFEIAGKEQQQQQQTNEQQQQQTNDEKQQSGCILLDQQGRILYSYLCTDSSDWPDVEVLLEQVRLNQTRRPSTAAAKSLQQNGGTAPNVVADEGGHEQQQQQGERPPSVAAPQTAEKMGNGNSQQHQQPGMVPSAAVGTSDTSGGEVAVHKRKCCIIM